jgi:hypothetical protein
MMGGCLLFIVARQRALGVPGGAFVRPAASPSCGGQSAVTVLAPRRSSRLTSQAFNSLGTTVYPYV